MTIEYISAICGGRKTTTAIRVTENFILNRKRFIIFQPTTALNKKTDDMFSQITRMLGKVRVVNTTTGDGSETVSKRLHDLLTNPGECQVIIATMESAIRLKRRDLGGWNAIIDEVPDVFQTTAITSQTVQSHLMHQLDFLPSREQDGYLRVTIKNGQHKAVHDLYVEAQRDPALKSLAATAQALGKELKTHVSETCYQAFTSGRAKSLTFYHVLMPRTFRGYESVTMMAANFEESLLYRIWSRLGVRFRKRDGLGGVKLPSEHPRNVGEKLTIYYSWDHLSKALKTNKTTGPLFQSEYRRIVSDIFGSEEYIHTHNQDDDPHILERIGIPHFVRPKAHGLNDYRDIHNASIYAVLNMSADRVSFLNRFYGISREDIWRIQNNELIYQFACRTSLRDFSQNDDEIAPKKVFAASKDQALYLQSKFPGSKVVCVQSMAIGSLPVSTRGRKAVNSVAESGSQRQKCFRHNRKQSRIDYLTHLLGISGPSPYSNGVFPSDLRNEITLNKERIWPSSRIGNLYDTGGQRVNFNTFDAIVKWLRDCSSRNLPSKTNNSLFNLTEFQSDDDIFHDRKLCSVVGSHAILMDMDSEMNCDPVAFSNLVKRIEFVCYSTFSSSSDHLRWRAVIPLSRPVTSKEYRKIASEILKICREHGFPFDEKKKNANDIMYLPGTGKNPDAAFFEHFTGQGRQFLDVDRWMGTPASPEPMPDAIRGSCQLSDVLIAA